MHSAASEQETSSWLVSDGLKELELLLRAVLSHQSEPILIVDDDQALRATLAEQLTMDGEFSATEASSVAEAEAAQQGRRHRLGGDRAQGRRQGHHAGLGGGKPEAQLHHQGQQIGVRALGKTGDGAGDHRGPEGRNLHQ